MSEIAHNFFARLEDCRRVKPSQSKVVAFMCSRDRFRFFLQSCRKVYATNSPVRSQSRVIFARSHTTPHSPPLSKAGVLSRRRSIFGIRDMASSDQAPHCKVILASTIAKALQAEIQEGVKKLNEPPLLVGLLATADEGARVYAEFTRKTCTEK